MAIADAFDQSLGLVCFAFRGSISRHDIPRALEAFFSVHSDIRSLKVLNVFVDGSDLSSISGQEFFDLSRSVAGIFKDHGIVGRKSCFLVRKDAGEYHLSRLWRAIHAIGQRDDFEIEVFSHLRPALDFLGCDYHEGEMLMDRAVSCLPRMKS